MKDYQKLEQRINALITEYRQHQKNQEQFQKQKNALQAKEEELKGVAIYDKINFLYTKIMGFIPPEKADALEQALEAKFAERAHDIYLSAKKNASMSRALKTPEQQKNFLLHICTQSMLKNDLVWDILNIATEHIDNKDIDEAIEASENFLSPKTNNIPVYYFKDKVEKMKKRNEDIFPDGDLVLKELNEELDTVAKTVITSSMEYGDEQGNPFEQIYDHNNIERLETNNTELIQEEKYKKYTQYFNMMIPDTILGTPDVNPDRYGDASVAENFFNSKEVPFVVSDKVSKGLNRIINFMREKDMLVNTGVFGEDGSKAYGFKQIKAAVNRLDGALSSLDPYQIKAAREEYETAVQNMREVYKMIKEEFDPTSDMMVGNISSYRESWVPGEFKNSLLYNSFASAIYNLAMNLDANHCSVDEFCKNPQKTFFQLMKGFTAKATPNSRFESTGLVTGIIRGVQKKAEPTPYPYGGVSRNIEFMVQLSMGTPEFRTNAFAGMMMQSYDGYIYGIADGHKNYMAKNTTETLANIFIVKEEDRNFDKLRAYEAVKTDGTGTIPAFDTIDYIESKHPDPAEIAERIKNTIEQIVENNRSEDPLIDKASAEDMLQIIRGAQMAAYEYMMIFPEPLEGTKKGYESLKQILENPQKAFPKAVSKKVLEGLRKAKEAGNSVAVSGDKTKSVLEQARSEARTAEAAYAEKIKGVTDQEKLQELRLEEIARLEKAYADGKLPKDYFEQRRVDVEFGNHENTVPFGVSERPTMKQFKAQHAEDFKEMSSEEIKYLYNSMMENAKREENKFLLIAAGNHPKPTPDVHTPAAKETEKQAEKIQLHIPPEILGEKTVVKSPEVKQTVAKIEDIQLK